MDVPTNLFIVYSFITKLQSDISCVSDLWNFNCIMIQNALILDEKCPFLSISCYPSYIDSVYFTFSIILACAHFGAMCGGNDIDYNIIYGRGI